MIKFINKLLGVKVKEETKHQRHKRKMREQGYFQPVTWVHPSWRDTEQLDAVRDKLREPLKGKKSIK